MERLDSDPILLDYFNTFLSSKVGQGWPAGVHGANHRGWDLENSQDVMHQSRGCS